MTAAEANVRAILSEAQLDFWLRRQPGRCRRCGYHLATQGHHPDCNRRQAA